MADATATLTPTTRNGVDTLYGGAYVTDLQYQAQGAITIAIGGENIYDDNRDSSAAGGDDITSGRSGRRSIEALDDPAHPISIGDLLGKARGLPLSSRHLGHGEPASDFHPILERAAGLPIEPGTYRVSSAAAGFHC
jgi:hypothetical protein